MKHFLAFTTDYIEDLGGYRIKGATVEEALLIALLPEVEEIANTLPLWEEGGDANKTTRKGTVMVGVQDVGTFLLNVEERSVIAGSKRYTLGDLMDPDNPLRLGVEDYLFRMWQKRPELFHSPSTIQAFEKRERAADVEGTLSRLGLTLEGERKFDKKSWKRLLQILANTEESNQ